MICSDKIYLVGYGRSVRQDKSCRYEYWNGNAFVANPVKLSTVITGGTYQYSGGLPSTAGSYVVQVQAFDNAENVGKLVTSPFTIKP